LTTRHELTFSGVILYVVAWCCRRYYN